MTPHGLEFAPVAELYRLDYVRATGRASFREGFAAALASPASRLLEVRTDGAADHARRQALLGRVQQQLW